MTSIELTPEQNRLLVGVAAGDLPVDDHVVRGACQDPRFAEALELMLRVQGQLRGARNAMAARDGADDVDGTDATDDDAEPFAGADELVRNTVHRLAGLEQSNPVPSSSRWRTALLLAAAAVVVVLGFWMFRAGDGSGLSGGGQPGGQRLGGGRIQCETPLGIVDGYGEFRWQWQLPARGYFVVRVYTSDERELVVESNHLDTNSWTPAASLPAAIHWEVRAYTGTGSQQSWGSGEARLR